MPIYQYQCSSCETIFETFESMTENAENPTPHCPHCDPDFERPTTMFKYLGNCKPSFVITGGGVHSPGWH